MIFKYKENWEKAKERYDAFWNKDYIDRCCLAIRIRKEENREPLILPRSDYTYEEHRTNLDYVFMCYENYVKNTIHLADSIPAVFPGFGVAAHSCYFGSVLNYDPNTIWFEPVIHEPDINKLVYSDEFLNIHKKFTSELSKRADGLFFVANNDHCGIIDALVNLRGNAELLMDLKDNPEFVTAARIKITEAWKKAQKELYDITKKVNDGGSAHNWMQTWARGNHGQLQCDFSVMISPEHYEKFVLPEIYDCTDFYDNSIYHLDGQEQIRHLDMLLSVKKLDVIQWTPVVGQPPTTDFIEVLKKIQKADKGLVLMPAAAEVPFLLKNLSHKSLMIIVSDVKDVDEANDLIKLAEENAN